MSDTDVLAAMAFADRALTTGKRWARTKQGEPPRQDAVRPEPLAIPLARLFAGDNQAAHVLTRIMAKEVYDHSFTMRVRITRHAAFDMARACLAWSRDGVCRTCGGHGKTLIPGTKTHSEHDCQSCQGAGRIPLERNFRQEHRDLARWLVAEIERQIARPWAEAARSLARDMDF